MAATSTIGNYGRIAVMGNVSAILCTYNANSAVYAAASGGLPIDLTGPLTQGQQNNDQTYINPGDVVGIIPLGLSTNGFLPTGLVVGTPTYTAQVGSGYGSAAGLPPAGSSQGSDTDNTLTTCPATIRLVGIGAAVTNHSALGEVADGANTDVFTFILLVARGGVNP